MSLTILNRIFKSFKLPVIIIQHAQQIIVVVKFENKCVKVLIQHKIIIKL